MVGGFVLGMPSRRTNNFHESGCGIGHVTATIFGSTVGYPSNSLASCLESYNLPKNTAYISTHSRSDLVFVRL